MNNEGFRVETPEQAAWAMRKYRQQAQQVARVRAMAQQERDRIDRWEMASTASVEGKMEFFGGHLEAYAMQQRAKGFKTVDLPDGVIKTRQSSASFEVDRSTFIDWAQDAKRDDLLRVTFAPDLTTLKATAIVNGGTVIDGETGEVIPGVTPVPERVTVKIEADLEALDLEDIEEEIDDVE